MHENGSKYSTMGYNLVIHDVHFPIIFSFSFFHDVLYKLHNAHTLSLFTAEVGSYKTRHFLRFRDTLTPRIVK